MGPTTTTAACPRVCAGVAAWPAHRAPSEPIVACCQLVRSLTLGHGSSYSNHYTCTVQTERRGGGQHAARVDGRGTGRQARTNGQPPRDTFVACASHLRGVWRGTPKRASLPAAPRCTQPPSSLGRRSQGEPRRTEAYPQAGHRHHRLDWGRGGGYITSQNCRTPVSTARHSTKPPRGRTTARHAHGMAPPQPPPPPHNTAPRRPPPTRRGRRPFHKAGVRRL